MQKFLMVMLPFALIGARSAYADGEITEILTDQFTPLIDPSLPKDKRYQSIIVGVVTPHDRVILSLGELQPGGNAPTTDTLFEIGSITKGFLGLVLARAAAEHKIALEDPVNSASSLNLPDFEGREITWREVANHTSGLPRLPANLVPQDPLQPYWDYDARQLKEFLSKYRLSSKPGTISEYSNLGAGIVGYSLEQLYGEPLEKILRSTILDPAGMPDTTILLSSHHALKMAPVFLNGEEVPYWQWKADSVMQGAGSLKSTLSDMLHFLEAMMGRRAEALYPYILESITPSFRNGNTSIVSSGTS